MTWEKRAIGGIIFGEGPGPEGLLEKHSTVLSCGGIFIPHPEDEQRALLQILTTSSEKEPVRIVTGLRPRNILHEVMLKESMN